MTKRSPTARPTAERIPREPVGPLAATVVEELRTWLDGLGYSPSSAAGLVNLAKRLSVWMRDAGADVGDIDQELLVRFDRTERARDIVCTTVTQSSGTFRRFLTDAGYLAQIATSTTSPAQTEIASWRSWMLSYLGLVEKSVDAHCRYASGLIEVITDDSAVLWNRLDAVVINAFVADSGRPYSLATRADIISSVRCLLRWALSTGRLDTDFRAAILGTARHRRCVPRGVAPEQVAALLGACDLATVVGARDRALVILLNRLGLRAGEAARLTLDDIDWVHGCLRVTGKGREHVLPLPDDVGTAVEAWLRIRPEALDRSVFVRTRAPRRQMTVNGLSGVIARLSDIAGIERIYAHRLRHTAATNVLAGGGSLSEAKELLGHAHTATTMIYAHADLVALRELVVPFGQVPR